MDITIKEYLDKKGISYIERNGELLTQCLFHGCDADQRLSEDPHLYFNVDTGEYFCHKCHEEGNLIKLRKFLGDIPQRQYGTSKNAFNPSLVNSCHYALPDKIREYLNTRGISNSVIDQFKLGYGTFWKKVWITIPIKDEQDHYVFFKLRQDPQDGSEKILYPRGSAQLFNREILKNAIDNLLICEGELDCLTATSKGIMAVSSTGGAGTFKDNWISELKQVKNVHICYDNDDAGRSGTERVIEKLKDTGIQKIYKVTLPEEVGEKGDITDYFTSFNGSVDDLFTKYAHLVYEEILFDPQTEVEMYTKEICEALDATIKYDNAAKTVVFFSQLSAFTGDAQINVILNAPSSAGKTYIPLEIAKIFPQKNIDIIGYSSPTAFFHKSGTFDEEKGMYIIDFSNKVLIFQDQPHYELLSKLRPLLDHSMDHMKVQISDKTQNYSYRTKEILLTGIPVAIFCSVSTKLDDQEATRFLIVSPEITQEKIHSGILLSIQKQSDSENFKNELEANPFRTSLKKRVLAISKAGIRNIKINPGDRKIIEEKFFEGRKTLSPRNARDIMWVTNLIKTFTLFNLWWRGRVGDTIFVSRRDIDEGFDLWNKLATSQQYNISPFIFDIAVNIILRSWAKKNKDNGLKENVGLTKQDILDAFRVDKSFDISYEQLTRDILPMLRKANIVFEMKNEKDKRQRLVFPTQSFIDAFMPDNNVDEGGQLEQHDGEDSEIEALFKKEVV